MLDQNTDRMWYVIGAVIVGAAIIFLANGTLPSIFASVTDGFSDTSHESLRVIDGLNRTYGPNIVLNANETRSKVKDTGTGFLRLRYEVDFDALSEMTGETIEVSFEFRSTETASFQSYIIDITSSGHPEYYSSSRHTSPIGESHDYTLGDWTRYTYTTTVNEALVSYQNTSLTIAANDTDATFYVRNPSVRQVK